MSDLVTLSATLEDSELENALLEAQVNAVSIGLAEVLYLLSQAPGQRQSSSNYEGALGKQINQIIQGIQVVPGESRGGKKRSARDKSKSSDHSKKSDKKKSRKKQRSRQITGLDKTTKQWDLLGKENNPC